MKTGLVLGKFAPLHKGHVFLFEGALRHVDFLYIVFCEEKMTQNMPVNKWIHTALSQYQGKYQLITYSYNSNLDYTDDLNPRVSIEWAVEFQKFLPKIDFFFSSEKYGDNFAKYMKAEHISVDWERKNFPISARELRLNLYDNWKYLPPYVQIDLQRQFVFCGTESVGKTTATRLCYEQFKKYNAHMVREYGREVISHSRLTTYEQLTQIALMQERRIASVNCHEIPPMVFIDTDWQTTEGYRKYLFPYFPTLSVPQRKNYSRSTDYLFLKANVPYIDDGTRLSESQRLELEECHRQVHTKAHVIDQSTYMNRMEKIYKIIDSQKSFNHD